MFLDLDTSISRIPTDATVECEFGDGLKLNEKLDSLEADNTTSFPVVRWKINHNYAHNGEYNVSCK